MRRRADTPAIEAEQKCIPLLRAISCDVGLFLTNTRASEFSVLVDGHEGLSHSTVDTLWKGLKWAAGAKRGRAMVVTDRFGRLSLCALLSSLLARSPLVMRSRGDFFGEVVARYERRRSVAAFVRYKISVVIAKLVLSKVDGVIFNSDYLRQTMRGRLRSKTATIVAHNPYRAPVRAGHPVRISPLPQDGAGLRLLTVTNFGLWPKVRPLFLAVKDWVDAEFLEGLGVRWMVCGGKFYADHFSRTIEEFHLRKYISYLGIVPDVERYYEWCDVLIHLTEMDAFPNVTMEAMAHGKPIVTNLMSCGTREQVKDGFNGVVVEGREGFREALKAYRDHPELRKQHGENGRKLVFEKFVPAAQSRIVHEFLLGLARDHYGAA